MFVKEPFEKVYFEKVSRQQKSWKITQYAKSLDCRCFDLIWFCASNQQSYSYGATGLSGLSQY